jgi:uncharacterized protein (DUF2345 family)
MSYRELFTSSLAVALVAGIAVFASAGRAQSPAPDQVPPAAAAPAAASQEGARVTTPYGDVTVAADRGKVRVEAPYSSVRVDADAGQVKVRAPYVNLDVRW